MTETMWSFVLAAGSIGGLWVVSKKPTIGWAWTLIMEFLWVTYAALIGQWGFMVLCICYAIVYTFNLYKSRRTNVEKILGGSESSSTSSNYRNNSNVTISTTFNYEMNDGQKTGVKNVN
jgi:hypothetical protein